LVSQQKLFQIGDFNFKLYHILVIGLLILAFSTTFLIRSQPTQYGFELNEFDPFFNFRATEYIVENGLIEYFEWNDDKSWYPYGRDVSSNSQIMLHITAAISYQIFGGNSSLYDFTILFPAVIGSLTVIVVFALVRVLGGTTAGVIASLLFAVALPVLVRGSIGWFKSEPLGLFYGLLGLYLFLSGIRTKDKKFTILKIVSGGIILSFGMASWGGNQFFIIPIGLFILALPLVRKDHKFLAWSIPLFVTTFLLCSASFERPGPQFVVGLGGMALLIPTLFLFVNIFIQKISKEENKIKHGSIFLIIVLIISILFMLIVGSYFSDNVSFRYLNAIYPFLTTVDPLTDSVSEHAITSTSNSFYYHSIFMIFGLLGAWIIFTKNVFQSKIVLRNDMRVFALITGMTGVYIGSAFIRLELFASISLIILSSIGLSILIKELFKIQISAKKNYLLKIASISLISILFMIPLVYPENNWITTLDYAPTIFTGGTNYLLSTNDWLDTLDWIKNNTPENSIIGSWWDYGYWIQTIADRTTTIDNATLNGRTIKEFAAMYLSTPDDAYVLLKEMNIDYLVVFVAAEKLQIKSNLGESLYVLNGGGDESKKTWFMRIAQVPLEKYLNSDGMTGTDYFWNETLLGNAIPFKPLLWFNENTQQQSPIYQPGFVPISIKDIKYDYDRNTPLNLVYSSPSFTNDNVGIIHAVHVFKINENYDPIKNQFDQVLEKSN
jgi:dolichyl-diphosphooligosaccharide--protein glycosyltransferase